MECKESQGTIVPTIYIVPMLAFDKNLTRMGYGGGYFDRYIQKNKREGVYFIGVAYDEQYVGSKEFLPTESSDHPLDFIVTQSRVLSR